MTHPPVVYAKPVTNNEGGWYDISWKTGLDDKDNIGRSPDDRNGFVAERVSTQPKKTKVVIECKENLTTGEIICTQKIVVTWQEGNATNMDLLATENLSTSFTNSPNAFLGSDNPVGSIVLKSNGIAVAAKTVTYQQNGQEIIPTDTANLVSWLSAHNGQANEIMITLDNMKFEQHSGVNLVVAEVIDNGNVIAGGSTSWYYNGSMLNTAASADFGN